MPGGDANLSKPLSWMKARSFTKRPCASCLPGPAPLLALPEWTERAIFAVREILALFMRTAHVALAHHHRLDAVLAEEVLHFLLDFRVSRNVCGDPALNDCLGPVMQDDASGNLRRGLVVRAVKSHSAHGVLWRQFLPALHFIHLCEQVTPRLILPTSFFVFCMLVTADLWRETLLKTTFNRFVLQGFWLGLSDSSATPLNPFSSESSVVLAS